MDISEFNISEIISLFHREAPLSYLVKENTWQQDDDFRCTLYVEFPDEKCVIKFAHNAFTTAERINGWVGLIARYGEMGYYSPVLRKSVNGNYSENFEHGGKTFIVWEEEFAKYLFPDQVENKPKNDSGTRYIYSDGLIGFFGRVGEARLSNTWGKSAWARLVPFGDDKTDEVTEYVEEFDRLVKSRAPQFADRWRRLLALWESNRDALRRIYDMLPTSVFQPDDNVTNLLIDEDGNFKGVIDYNLSGSDVCINIFISAAYCGLGDLRETPAPAADDTLRELNETVRRCRIDIMLDGLREISRNYTFSEIEITAAPLLYRYVFSVNYESINAFNENADNDSALCRIFDFIEHELTRTDIDWKGALADP